MLELTDMSGIWDLGPRVNWLPLALHNWLIYFVKIKKPWKKDKKIKEFMTLLSFQVVFLLHYITTMTW